MDKNTAKSFEDLAVWKDAMNLVLVIYEKFKICKDYGFKDQIQRAGVSIPSNIAEGFERNSDKEFIHFLYIARGSCAEVRTQLYLAVKLKYIQKEEGKALIEMTKKISSMIYKLIAYRKNGEQNR